MAGRRNLNLPRSSAQRRLRLRLALLITAVAAMLAMSMVPAAAETAAGGYDHDDLERDLAAITAAGVTGVQARVITEDGEQLVATSGVADIATRQPVDPEGHYRIGSNTKTFIATVILQLVAEGRLSLADTVEEHLPGVVAGNGNDGSQITIRQLLQHTSGLPNYTNELFADLTPERLEKVRNGSYDPEDLVAMALGHAPDFAPGTRWSYSNTGYVLAGMLIEAATGNTWEQEVTQRILKPLELNDTSMPGDAVGLPEPHARGYEHLLPGGPPVDVTEFTHSWADAAGEMISTTQDLSRFFRALLAGQLLPPEQLAQMQSTIRQAAAAPVGSGYGLGLAKAPLSCGQTAWAHGGDTLGFHSREGFSADGQRSVVISMTSGVADAASFAAVSQAVVGLIERVLCA